MTAEELLAEIDLNGRRYCWCVQRCRFDKARKYAAEVARLRAQLDALRAAGQTVRTFKVGMAAMAGR